MLFLMGIGIYFFYLHFSCTLISDSCFVTLSKKESLRFSTAFCVNPTKDRVHSVSIQTKGTCDNITLFQRTKLSCTSGSSNNLLRVLLCAMRA